MTNKEKREFIERVHTELADALDARAEAFKVFAVRGRIFALSARIVPDSELDGAYALALSGQAALAQQNVQDNLAAAGVSIVAPAVGSASTGNWELP